MPSNLLTLGLLSYFIGFLFLLFIRSYDKYDKEPLWRLVLFSFIGGLVAIGVSTVLYGLIHPKYNLTDAILKVGTVEEFSKLATLFILYKLIKKEFDEIVDGIIYIAAISLGFSVIENIFYALHAPHPFGVLFKRFLFATIGHISFSVYMGIAFYVHKKIHKNYLGLFWAFMIATLAHGFYDGFIFNKNLTYLFLPLYILLIIFQFRLLKVAYTYSKMKADLIFSNLNPKNRTEKISCCHCNHQESKIYDFKNARILICENCQNAIIPRKDFNKLLQFFRPKLNRKAYFKNLSFIEHPVYIDKGLTYYADKQRFNANMDDLSVWLKSENVKDLHIYNQTLEGRIFQQLGFKYLS